MKIEDNLLAVSNCMFKDKQNWKFVTDEQKTKYFFIINRLISKKYPDVAQLLNHKTINQVVGMDLIYSFMLDKPYPSWIWSKSDKSNTSNYEDLKLLSQKLGISIIESEILFNRFNKEVQEELSYYKKLNKN